MIFSKIKKIFFDKRRSKLRKTYDEKAKNNTRRVIKRFMNRKFITREELDSLSTRANKALKKMDKQFGKLEE